MPRRASAPELTREARIRRLHRVSEDLTNGLTALVALHDAASGFPRIDLRLRRLARALTSLRRGDVWSDVPVDGRLLRLVDALRMNVASWRQSGAVAPKVAADAKRVWVKLRRPPPTKAELCSICQEKRPFLGGRAGGGICVDCIKVAHAALIDSEK